MLDWLFHPLAMYAFLAVALGMDLWLFISLELEHAASKAASERRARALEEALDEMRRRVAALERGAARERETVEARPAEATTAELQSGDLNLTRRSQVLRLARRGESPDRIAVVLGIPQNEVHLLLKVQEIVTETLH